jgi:hypothetical protein
LHDPLAWGRSLAPPAQAQPQCEVVSSNACTNPPTIKNKPINRRSCNGVMGECLRCRRGADTVGLSAQGAESIDERRCGRVSG